MSRSPTPSTANTVRAAPTERRDELHAARPRTELGVPLLRSAAACVVLLLLAAPHWAALIDDLLITTAYAHEWVNTGVLRWTSGEVVEGYSNFLWLMCLSGGAAVGVDTLLLAKVLSMGSAMAFLCALSLAAPKDWRGHLLVLAVATWAPLGYWAAIGMETTLFALLLAGGWACALRNEAGARATAVALLALAALTHPEGHAHLGLALIATCWRRPRWERADVVAVAVILGLVGYHGWRVAHFGHFWPTPYLSKISSVHAFDRGLPQVGREVVTAAGILGAAALVVRPRLRDLPWVLLPLAIQAALLLRANGDWMGWARFLLPGVLAAVLASVAVTRATTARSWTLLPVLIAVVMGGLYEPRDQVLARRDFQKIREPLASYTSGFGPAIPEDTEYVVENVPDGDTVLVSDVGMVGNIPGVRIRDIAGLVDRRIAEEKLSDVPWDPETGALMYGPGADQIAFLRVVNWDGGETATLDRPLLRRFVSRADVYATSFHATWYRTHDERPGRETSLARWRELHRRYPRMGWLRWRTIVAEVDAGAAPAYQAERGYPGLRALPESLSFTTGPLPLVWEPGRGFALYSNGTLTSRPLRDEDLVPSYLVLDVQDPGVEGAAMKIDVGPCSQELYVLERTAIPLRGLCDQLATGDRIRVTFGNDLAAAGQDRNAYALLTAAPDEPTR